MKAAGQSFSVTVAIWFRLALVLGLVWGGAGCKPKIGEDCTTSVDCSISADRICDTTQPGGYCTVFNCEPNNCPDEAVCVAFGEGTCSTAGVSTRFRRTFCMRTCEEDGDCRGGSYKCLDVSRDPARQIVDSNPSSRRICAVPSTQPPADNATYPDPPVCFPSDASFDVSRPETGPISRDAPVEADVAETSRVDARDSSPAETGSDAPSDAVDGASSDSASSDSASNDAVDDAAEEPEATLVSR
jgi:hypothetical protein